MIEFTDTTVFNVPAMTLVNTVNCVGVMGAGLALEFKLRFPEMFQDYTARCRLGAVAVGSPYLYKPEGDGEPWVLNFPTKLHWRDPSRIEWVEAGLKRFTEMYRREGITSVAFPPLGCTNGGLSWEAVRPLMERHLEPLDAHAYLCLDREAHATGVEGRMVECINDGDPSLWIEALRLPPDTAASITNALPLRRFRDLLRLPGMIPALYGNLFRFFYQLACDPASPPSPASLPPQEPLQLSLPFD
ncbi:MAG: macro domain-containing protein [Armatimonadetes bacterium]|nr:macro domain-containing protein [Armatimonadota bacterium]